ncbi:class I SAM-dependent methyltransferase [Flexibacterium corallicola]|uniref:class I SAM-dependent methyltransferase n=1 Tax=Flexibacterium corallicola TaxID=3037259 RepID=UPI00286F146F|nr:class I SAM-dependent methyltransferase [Pseudovibrio sp. M1P-2-3]
MSKFHSTTGKIQRTANNRGFVMYNLSQASRDFIEFASHTSKPSLDMGSAFGIATHPLLEKRKEVIACDLSQEFLDILRSETPDELLPYLTTQTGCFPRDFDFEEDSIGAILCSHVFHFLTGKEVLSGLGQFRKWLCKGGKLFLTISTHKHPLLGDFPNEFQKRKQSMEWPGEMSEKDIEQFFTMSFKNFVGPDAIPKFCHAFDEEIMMKALNATGFEVEQLHTYTQKVTEELQQHVGENNFLAVVAH